MGKNYIKAQVWYLVFLVDIIKNISLFSVPCNMFTFFRVLTMCAKPRFLHFEVSEVSRECRPRQNIDRNHTYNYNGEY